MDQHDVKSFNRQALLAPACVLLFALASCGSSTPSAAASPTPLNLPQMPLKAAPGSGGTVLLPLTAGVGAATLPEITPKAGRLYVEVACLGPGAVQVEPIMTVEPCTAAGVFTNQIDGFKDQVLQLKVDAPAGTRWEVFITEGPSS